MLLRLAVGGGGQFIEDGLYAPGQIGSLLVEQAQPWQQHEGVFAGGFGGSRGQSQGLGFQRGPQRAGIDAADAVLAEDALEFSFSEPGGSEAATIGSNRHPVPWRRVQRCDWVRFNVIKVSPTG
jgi:hypothetical protein